MPSCTMRPTTAKRGTNLTLCPYILSRLTISTATVTITLSLLLTQYYPGRFHIHPLPYLSDAGLRDPERFILSLGLCFSAITFIPLVLIAHLHHREGLYAGLSIALSLITFTTVPGWWAPHHIFAALFAISAVLWCHAFIAGSKVRRVLVAVQVVVIAVFAITWASIKIQWPYPLIRNKDRRFVVLALGEYLGTTAFLIFVAIMGDELKRQRLEFCLRRKGNRMDLFDV